MKTLVVFMQDKVECVSGQGERLRPDAAAAILGWYVPGDVKVEMFSELTSLISIYKLSSVHGHVPHIKRTLTHTPPTCTYHRRVYWDTAAPVGTMYATSTTV